MGNVIEINDNHHVIEINHDIQKDENLNKSYHIIDLSSQLPNTKNIQKILDTNHIIQDTIQPLKSKNLKKIMTRRREYKYMPSAEFFDFLKEFL